MPLAPLLLPMQVLAPAQLPQLTSTCAEAALRPPPPLNQSGLLLMLHLAQASPALGRSTSATNTTAANGLLSCS